MIIIWTQTVTPQAPSFGDDPEDGQYDKEHWKPRVTFRLAVFLPLPLVALAHRMTSCTTMQVYDLAWSPNGDYVIAGSTDNVARIFSTPDGSYHSEYTFP